MTQAQVTNFLKENRQEYTPKKVAELLEMNESTIISNLFDAHKNRYIKRRRVKINGSCRWVYWFEEKEK